MKSHFETWCPLTGFPYEVSTAGRVRRVGGKPLTPRVRSNGYHRVYLGAGNERSIHRLVCEAFHGPSPVDGWHADHINGIRGDNRPENLRWLSPEENRSLRRNRRGERHGNAKLTEDRVRAIRRANDPSQDRTFAVEFGCSRETVRDARLGKVWGHVQ